MERSARQRLMASPACPAPTITVVTTYESGPPPHGETADRAAVQFTYDRDIRRIGDDVVDCGALLRLRHERLDILALRIGVDLVAHLDAAEAVADLAVDAEDALEVHVAFDRRRDRRS